MDDSKTKRSVATQRSVTQFSFFAFFCVLLLNASTGISNSLVDLRHRLPASPRLPVSASASARIAVPAPSLEYLWYEAENMRGLTETSQHEPQLNPSYL